MVCIWWRESSKDCAAAAAHLQAFLVLVAARRARRGSDCRSLFTGILTFHRLIVPRRQCNVGILPKTPEGAEAICGLGLCLASGVDGSSGPFRGAGVLLTGRGRRVRGNGGSFLGWIMRLEWAHERRLRQDPNDGTEPAAGYRRDQRCLRRSWHGRLRPDRCHGDGNDRGSHGSILGLLFAQMRDGYL